MQILVKKKTLIKFEGGSNLKILLVAILVVAIKATLFAGAEIPVIDASKASQVIVRTECGDVVISQPIEDWQIVTAGPDREVLHEGTPLKKAAVAQKAQQSGYVIPPKELKKLDALERGLARERQRNDRQDRLIDANKKAVDGLRGDFDKLSGDQGLLAQKTTQIEEELVDLSKKITEHDREIGLHNNFIVGHENRLLALEKKPNWGRWLIWLLVVVVLLGLTTGLVRWRKKK